MNREDLKDGEIYSHSNGNIVKYESIVRENTTIVNGKYIGDIKGCRNYKTIGGAFIVSELKEATPEQKHWLEVCIQHDKFVEYDEAIKTFAKEFVLPEKWLLKVEPINQTIIRKWGDKMWSSDNYICNTWKELKSNTNHILIGNADVKGRPYYMQNIEGYRHHTEITFEQFKQYVLKEKQLLYTILKQDGDKILQVSNQEGSIFDIGDIVQGLNIKKYQIIPLEIIGFRFNKANDGIIATCNKPTSNGISIDKIEHYIESKVGKEFVLPEIWWVRVTNENKEILTKWRHSNTNTVYPRSVGELVGMSKSNDIGTITKGHNRVNITKSDDKYGYNFGNEITFDQFKKYVLKEIEVKTNPNQLPTFNGLVQEYGMVKASEMAKDAFAELYKQLEESLLDKAKRLYPIGTKFKSPQNNNIYTVKSDHRKSSLLEGYILCKTEESAFDSSEYLYFRDQWAEIIEQRVDNSIYEILSFYDLHRITINKILKNGEIENRKGYSVSTALTNKLYIDNIHSVKQLSTDKIFTVGDKVNLTKWEHLWDTSFSKVRTIKSINLTENNFIQFEFNSLHYSDLNYNKVLMQNCVKVE